MLIYMYSRLYTVIHVILYSSTILVVLYCLRVLYTIYRLEDKYMSIKR